MTKVTSYQTLYDAWLKNGEKHYREFIDNSSELESHQRSLLRGILRKAGNSKYGMDEGIHTCKDYEGFRDTVNVVDDYSQIEKYIERVLRGEKHVLTSDDIIFCETTSGSSGFQKIIPYTESMRSRLEAGIFIWLNAIRKRVPKAFSGPSFWSLSPSLKSPFISSGGLRVGVESDTELLHKRNYPYISDLVIQASNCNQHTEADKFYQCILVQLLAAENLSFISVWSPTYLLQLDKKLRTYRYAILQASDISNERRTYLEDLLEKKYTWKQIWPELSLVSCWTDAQASIWLEDLKKVVGPVELEGKGLIATEGISSLPIDDGKPVLAYTSHFFEFRDIETEEVLPGWKVQDNRTYELILTNGSGLVRYATSDMVKIKGALNTVPRLQFLGRSSSVSDLAGEKINEAMLLAAFRNAIQGLPAIQKNAKVIFQPKVKEGSAQYVMHLENVPDSHLGILKQEVERELHRNPYYAQAVELGQIRPLGAEMHSKGTIEAMMDILRTRSNVKDGDFKEKILLPRECPLNL